MIPESTNPRDLFNQMFWKVAGILTGQLLHDLLDLAFQHRDRVMPSVLSQGTDAVHERTSHETELGTASQRVGNIGSGSQTAIDHHRGSVTKFLRQFRERLDSRLSVI